MGYETDTVVLYNATITTAGTTYGSQFGGSDWVRGLLYVKLGTVAGSTPTLLVFLQCSPDGGTTWIGSAGSATAPFINSALYNGTSAQSAWTPTTGETGIIPVSNGFPGSTCRLGVTAAGTGLSLPLEVYGDFQKWLADSS